MNSALACLASAMIMSLGAAGCGSSGIHADRRTDAADGGTAADAAAPQASASAGMDDAAITTAVRAKLAADGKVPAESIDVDTKAGVVTLKGTVKSEQEKQEVLQVARDTQGVVKVEDLLTVKVS